MAVPVVIIYVLEMLGAGEEQARLREEPAQKARQQLRAHRAGQQRPLCLIIATVCIAVAGQLEHLPLHLPVGERLVVAAGGLCDIHNGRHGARCRRGYEAGPRSEHLCGSGRRRPRGVRCIMRGRATSQTHPCLCHHPVGPMPGFILTGRRSIVLQTPS